MRDKVKKGTSKKRWPIVCLVLGILFLYTAASGRADQPVPTWAAAAILSALGVWGILAGRKAAPASQTKPAAPTQPVQQPTAPVQPVQQPIAPVQPENPYVFINFNVAGTTYETNGKSRQYYLRKMKFGDPPFENQDSLDVQLHPTTFQGEDAVECLVNGILIGYVPRKRVPEVMEAFNHEDTTISGFHVVGGGKHGDMVYSYGVEMSIRYTK